MFDIKFDRVAVFWIKQSQFSDSIDRMSLKSLLCINNLVQIIVYILEFKEIAILQKIYIIFIYSKKSSYQVLVIWFYCTKRLLQ